MKIRKSVENKCSVRVLQLEDVPSLRLQKMSTAGRTYYLKCQELLFG